ncbi:glucosyl-3-phosphoglycerate synthase [Saccharopolyspora montiporae]|uniref:glucosyl-3-phosphoglycerate synthase n=1 Tax=Saccharopolyspora montiporae TaxID=2781240 RepID=UPI00351C1270
MRPETARWFACRTWQQPTWSVAELVSAKRARSVSVVLPALNEAATVGGIVTAIRPLTTSACGRLVDEIVVMDSGSTDRTCAAAAEAGARVFRRDDVLPTVDVRPGKGEVLWRSLAATTGDVVVFIDADLIGFEADFVPALLGPLLTEADPMLVKGFYRRPLGPDTGTADGDGGGRVTEILVRPLLAQLRPELGGVIQPIGGEYAARREFLASASFAPGYGVDIGLLLDAHERYGLPGLAQVNLGARRHRNRDLPELGVMSGHVLSAVLDRAGPEPGTDGADSLTQFVQVGGEWLPREHRVPRADRPPMRALRNPSPAGRGGEPGWAGQHDPATS